MIKHNSNILGMSYLYTFTGIFLAWSYNVQAQNKKPNFIIIQLDDLGWDDLSVHGNKYIETPAIDSFANQSIQFQRFYVNTVSAPSRASLLTGRHFLRTGVSHVHGGKDFINLNENTLAQTLKQNGYVTGMWGKWHSGHTAGYFPWQRGFDEAFMAKLYKHKNCEGLLNGDTLRTNNWADKVITDFAINFIELNKDTSFFAYIPYLTCHGPENAPEKYIQKYVEKGLSHNLSTLYGMIDFLDSQINRLLLKVNELGISENTVIIFMSDNGPAIQNHFLSDTDRNIRYVSKLKGHKGSLLENGIKSPLFIRWPNKFKPNIINRLVDVTDIYPTLLDLANIKPLNNQKPFDGRSIKPYLLGDTTSLSQKYCFDFGYRAWIPSNKPYNPDGINNEYNPVTNKSDSSVSFINQTLFVNNEKYKLILNPFLLSNNQNSVAMYNFTDICEENDIKDIETKEFETLKYQLNLWYNNILTEPNIFEMPVFQIGSTTDKNWMVLAKGPFNISKNLKNTYDYLKGWSQSGDSAKYHLNVLKTGNYSIIVNYKASAVGNIIRISIGSISTEFKIENLNKTTIHNFKLNEGTQTLKFEIVNFPNKKCGLEELYSFEFNCEATN